MPKRIALIPARGGSKGIPRKNLREVAGKSLLERSIEVARISNLFTDICVSTDDPMIAELALSFGANVPFLRPTELAGDESMTIDVIKHALKFYKEKGDSFETLTLLQPTTPFRKTDDLVLAHLSFDSSDYATLISVLDVSNFHPSTLYQRKKSIGAQVYEVQGLLSEKDFGSGQRRQTFEQRLWRNGSLYIFRPEILMFKASLITEPLMAFEMDWIRSINIDEVSDLELAQVIADALKI